MLRAMLARLERAATAETEDLGAVDRELVIPLPVFGPGDPLFLETDEVTTAPDGRRLVIRPVLILCGHEDEVDRAG